MIDILVSSFGLLAEAGPYVMFGFLAAGLLRVLLPEDAVSRHLGGRGLGPVLRASLLGIPLPLCSCGVIPAAVDLRRQGAGRGASVAFLVSTPESGVDSIAITWALLDPIMTVVRPVAAFMTATVTGLVVDALPPERPAEEAVAASSSSDCGCGDDCHLPDRAGEPPAMGRRIWRGVRYAFDDLLGDIGGWLLLGVLVAGAMNALLPPDLLFRYAGGGLGPMLVMLLAGIPLYICATASTPIAAALVLKGLSPGAALVFLLAGPATNAATIAIVARYWGRRVLAVYLGAIAVCSVGLGLLVDRLYAWSGADITDWVAESVSGSPGWFETASAALLLVLIGRHLLSGGRLLPTPSAD